jgi:signal peptidase
MSDDGSGPEGPDSDERSQSGSDAGDDAPSPGDDHADPGGSRTDGDDPRPDGDRPEVDQSDPPRSDAPRRNPPRQRRRDEGGPAGLRGAIHRFRTAESGLVMWTREVLSSIALVAVVGLVLFAISGVWPPMVAVQSGSMEPHMERGDLVFVVDENRFAGDAAIEGTGVIPYQRGKEVDHRKFGAYGDVIVYEPNANGRRDPIIHRAMFWVDEGENWYDKANETYVNADSCAELTNCPAPNAGFITKGDNSRTNRYYDQAQGMSRPVKPEWITGKAVVRIPGLGYIRLLFSEIVAGSALAGGGAASVGRAASS